ncbi:MAG: DUF4397 domain-containing protein [Microbacteriaceae bacterium]|nr:DUF4397 domain-containing protein [Microbacteriaceae bacterium]
MAGGVAGAFLLAALAVPMSASAATNAQLSVLHGIPGVTVDVWVNGKLTLNDFTPGTLAGPLSLAPATYSVAITASDATSATDKVVIGPIDLPLADGGNYTAVAHLDATTPAKPTATLFTNDISKTTPGQGRLTVRHVAAAPAVDVLAGTSPVIKGLTNPKEQILNLAPATISASVVAAGSTTPALIGPADVPVVEGQNTIVYAYGSLADKTLAVAVQTITGLHTPPAGIPAGQTGAAARAESTQQTQSTIGFGALGLLLAAAAAAVLVVTRRNAASRA